MTKVLPMILFVVFISCNVLESGKSGFSSNINESKKRGVFYKSKSVIHIENEGKLGEKIGINEFWYENMWLKGQSVNKIKIDSAYLQYSALLKCELDEDSLFVIYNKYYNIPLGVFHSTIYSYANLNKYEIPDTVTLEFFIKENSKQKKIKTVFLN